MILFKMAWRNVWRNYRRSSVTIAAMTLALVVEILYGGLIDGMMLGMEDDVTENEVGDMQIFADGYLGRPSIYDTVQGHERILKRLDDAGYSATARLYSGGLAAAGEASAGSLLWGWTRCATPKRSPSTRRSTRATGSMTAIPRES